MFALRKPIAVMLLISLSFLIHRHALQGWWWQDDATILMHAVSHPGASYFYRPDHWRDLIIASFTPWLSAVFSIDHAIAPWNPTFHYFHNLVSLGGCASLMTIWLWKRCGPLLAFAVGGLFLWGAPSTLVAQQLMTRHYVEGLLFIFLHFICIDLARQKFSLVDRNSCSINMDSLEQRAVSYWSWLAALFALLSMCAKELYLPLVLLNLIWLGRLELRVLRPSVFVMLFFLGWRAWMIGDWVGGYSVPDLSASDGEFSLVASVQILWARLIKYARIPNAIVSHAWLCFGIVLTALALRAFANAQAKKDVLWPLCEDFLKLGFALSLIAFPLWPLTKVSDFTFLDQRFYFAAWGFSLLGIGLAFKHHTFIGLLVVLSLSISAAKPREDLNQALGPIAKEYWVQGRAILESPSDSVLWLSPAVANWYADSLIQMRHSQGLGPIFAISDWIQMPSNVYDLKLFRYNINSDKAVMAVLSDDALRLERSAWKSAVSKGLSIDLESQLSYDYKKQVLAWRFEASENGRTHSEVKYTAILFEGGVFPLPPKGQLRTNDLTSGCLVLKAEGRNSQGQTFIAYSDVMRFSTERHQGVHAAISEATYRGPAINYQERPACSNRKGKAP